MAHIIIWNSFGKDKDSYNVLTTADSALRPVGPHLLACWLLKFGYHVKVIDFCNILTTQQLVDLTEKHIDRHTIAVGASTTFWREPDSSDMYEEPNWALKARGALEQRYPKLDWILGGPRASDNYPLLQMFRKRWKKFRGFAEDALLKYVDEQTNYKGDRSLFNIQNSDIHYLDDLSIDKNEVLNIELARGCQFKCSFCRFPLLGKKKGTYERSPILIDQELRRNYDRFGTTRYFLMDDTVNENEDKIISLAETASKLPFKLEWTGFNRADLIWSRPKTIQTLKDSGLRSSFFGIESFHYLGSKSVGKGWSGVRGKEFLVELKDHWKDEITFQLSFIIGLQGETEQDIDHTQQWCIDNKMYNWVWNGLLITTAPEVEWKSKFDLEYDKYGYSFPDPSKNWYWVNDNWNTLTAWEKQKTLNIESQKYTKLTTWRMVELATVGYQFSDVMKKTVHEVDLVDFSSKIKTLVNNYYTSQINL